MNKTEKLRDDLNCVVTFFQPLHPKLRCGRKTIDTFLHLLKSVPDFRDPLKITYKLENLLCLCFYLALKGEFTSFHHAALYIRVKQKELVKLKLIRKNETPSHDTLRRIFMYLDANALRDTFLNKIKELMNRLVELNQGEMDKKILLSGDGKSFNGSGRKDKSRNINVFNIYNASNGLCLSSTPLTDKESEIKEFQRLLPKFKLDRCVVTADALHCQRKTSSIIIEKKGEYVFKAKDNQKELSLEIMNQFKKQKEIEIFHYNQCDYSFIFLPQNYIGVDWPGVKAYVKMISYKRKKHDKAQPEPQYFIASFVNKELIMESIDNRWNIENGLHLFKDKFNKEDDCTFTDKTAIKTMATINNIVYALYRLASAVLNDASMAETKIRYKDNPIEMLSLILPLLDKKNITQLIQENMNGRKKK